MITAKLEEMERRFDEIEADLARAEIISNIEEYKKLAREHAELRETIAIFREWRKVKTEAQKTK
jgi:peptide chain release factor 1